jgi:hypothetical protein
MALPIIIWENRLSSTTSLTPTDTDSDPAYNVANLYDFRPYTRWKAASSGSKSISAAWASAVTVDSIAIVGHNLATVSADIYVDYVAAPWTQHFGPFTPSEDEAPVVIQFESQSKTGWRIRLDNCTAAPSVGVILIGQKLEFQRYVSEPYDPFGERVVAEQAISETGELLGSTFKYREHNISAQWGRLTEAWVRATFLPVWENHLSRLRPFVWAWNPASTWEQQAFYVALQPGAALQTPYDPIRQSLSLQMRGVHRP